MNIIYEFEIKNGEMHVYDNSGNELTNSPVQSDEGWEIPTDVHKPIISEMAEEFENNGFSQRLQEIIVVLANEQHIQRR